MEVLKEALRIWTNILGLTSLQDIFSTKFLWLIRENIQTIKGDGLQTLLVLGYDCVLVANAKSIFSFEL